jgi:CheY-like chemotaxis protein
MTPKVEDALPREAENRGREPTSARAPAPSVRGHETILLVEDEAAVLRATRRMLEPAGYTVLAANSPGEASGLVREYPGEIHLLVTDVMMPGMNGRELARDLLSRYPSMKCVFMSGYAADVIGHDGVLAEGVKFIQKPFSKQVLLTKVREALDEV